MPLSGCSHTKCVITILSWIIVFAVGCTSPFAGSDKHQNEVDVGDAGLLVHQACEPPCFWGITPGVTSITETRHILAQKDINECVQGGSDPRYPTMVCRNVALIELDTRTDLISGIGLDPVRHLTIGDVLSSRGQPSAISVTIQGVEHPRVTMMVYFDNIRTRIVLTEQDGTIYKLNSSVEIRNVGFYDSDTYTVARKYGSGVWRGYGQYQETSVH